MGTLADAAVVDRTTGKNADKKIRKTGEASPTPNQRMANGIQASGERLRKKLTIGKNAVRTSSFCPIHRPAGIPVSTASPNPQVTRKSDVTRSVKSWPLRISAADARTTANGEGKALSWKIPLRQTTVQIAIMPITTAKGRTKERKALDGFAELTQI